MSIEKKINEFISDFPIIKKSIKRLYQLFFYAISPKQKNEGNILRVTPDDGFEYFFGYYDKTPWDISNRYMLSLKVPNTLVSPAPKEKAEIVLIDTQNNNEIIKLGSTNTWNVQQGAMLQWLGPKFDEEIIYNDFRNGDYCSVILNVKTKEERIISKPVYSVSEDGKYALTLDFSRLHRLREGYGYSNKEETTKNEKVPNAPAIWKIDLINNVSTQVLTYQDFYNFESSPSMGNSEHKVNHIMLNPSGDRFMVLHRWYNGQTKHTRLVTANIDGSEMYNLNDHKMTSHCYWKNDDEIIAYANRNESGTGYYLFKDKSACLKKILNGLNKDGHPSYSPNGKYILTDTYPDRSRMASVYIAEENNIKTIARVFAPFKYDNDVRCDLHPRWNRTGTKICFDSVFEGKRALYTVDLAQKE